MVRPVQAPDGAPERPTAFGNYELVRRLAVGGMAEIFVARSRRLGGVSRTCVIKRILPEYSQNQQFVSMFIDEARILMRLEHPNVVRRYDFGQVEGSFFMALEYVPGCNLVAVLEKVFHENRGMVPLAAAYVAQQACLGLHHAHTLSDDHGRPLQVVHRDVSPHNILVSFLGDVKVVDFGIAQARNKLTLTVPGTVMGKFSYMAPEQATGSHLDARADIFSAGVVLHEALAGRRLFASAQTVDTIAKVMELQACAPSSVRPEVPAALDRVVLKALEKKPENRFSTALEMAEALEEVLRSRGGYSNARLAEYLQVEEVALAGVGVVDAGGVASTRRSVVPTVPALEAAVVEVTAQLPVDDEIARLHKQFRAEPNVWTVVAMGERNVEMARTGSAASAFRVAAGAFAFRGLLLQALVTLHRARPLMDTVAWESDVRRLAALKDGQHAALAAYMAACDNGGYFSLLCDAQPEAYAQDCMRSRADVPVPVYGSAVPEALVELMRLSRVQEYPAGHVIVREGDPGETLFCMGQGRVSVSCQAAEAQGGPLYITSLTEGDTFGEFGFLAGGVRSATVETDQRTWVLELDRKDVAHLLRHHSEISGPLLEFYKARVVDLQLAKNPVFKELGARDRAKLLSCAQPYCFRDGALIMEEGQPGDAFFFIKQGEVEIFQVRDGIPVFINKLQDGEFFGEIACIRGTVRSASVRAMSEVEVLRIGREDLMEVALDRPGVLLLLEEAATQRMRQAREQVDATQELLKS